jgi:hypothetical protein
VVLAGIIIPIARVPRHFGGSRPFFVCSGGPRRDDRRTDDAAAGVVGGGCGRRVRKLYLSRGRFLCRHCSQLVYASKYEQHPWQRAFRRAAKLRQRLGITGAGVPGKPKYMPVSDYERLLEAILQAEAQATEAGTARLLQLIAWLKPRFTL